MRRMRIRYVCFVCLCVCKSVHYLIYALCINCAVLNGGQCGE